MLYISKIKETTYSFLKTRPQSLLGHSPLKLRASFHSIPFHSIPVFRSIPSLTVKGNSTVFIFTSISTPFGRELEIHVILCLYGTSRLKQLPQCQLGYVWSNGCWSFVTFASPPATTSKNHPSGPVIANQYLQVQVKADGSPLVPNSSSFQWLGFSEPYERNLIFWEILNGFFPFPQCADPYYSLRQPVPFKLALRNNAHPGCRRLLFGFFSPAAPLCWGCFNKSGGCWDSPGMPAKIAHYRSFFASLIPRETSWSHFAKGQDLPFGREYSLDNRDRQLMQFCDIIAGET